MKISEQTRLFHYAMVNGENYGEGERTKIVIDGVATEIHVGTLRIEKVGERRLLAIEFITVESVNGHTAYFVDDKRTGLGADGIGTHSVERMFLAKLGQDGPTGVSEEGYGFGV